MNALPSTLTRPLIENNPIAVQFLGLCSALAVTKSLDTALVMSAALAAVLVSSNILISLLRHVIPYSARIVIQITIIASLVIVTNEVLAAFAPQMSRQLSIFVSLIITNCIVLGRAEAFAMLNGVGPSVLDALGNALGYALLLTLIGGVRELLGSGSLLGYPFLPLASEGGFFEPMRILLLPPAAFFLIAGLVRLAHGLRPKAVAVATGKRAP